MTRQVAINICCRMQALVSHTKAEYREPNDCFCRDAIDPSLYRNTHQSLRFIRDAVVEKLERGGLTPQLGLLKEINGMLEGNLE